MAIDSVDGRGVWDARMQGSHTSTSGASCGRKNVADCNVFDEVDIQVDLGVDSAEYCGKEFLRAGILEAAFLCL